MSNWRTPAALGLGLLLTLVLAAGALAQQGGGAGGNLITFDMKDAPLTDVLKYLKGQGGPDFTLEAGVDPNTLITLSVEKRPVDVVLQAVIDSAGLVAVRDGDMLMVRKRPAARDRTQRADAGTAGVQLPTGAGVTSRPEPARAAGTGTAATGAAAATTDDKQTRRLQLQYMDIWAWSSMLSGVLGSQMGGGGMGGGGYGGGGYGGGGGGYGGGGYGGNSWGGGGGGYGGGNSGWGGGGGNSGWGGGGRSSGRGGGGRNRGY